MAKEASARDSEERLQRYCPSSEPAKEEPLKEEEPAPHRRKRGRCHAAGQRKAQQESSPPSRG